MRRSEFQVEDAAEIEQFLQEMSFGHLAAVGADGWPTLTPLNYAYVGGKVYLHGSRAGEKMRTIAADGRVTFSVAKEYAILPSYYTDPLLACPATAYFKSVLFYGHAVVVEDLEEKAAAFEGLMRKLQPEGGYKTITADDRDYRGQLKGVAVIRIDAERVSAKFKFGQNLTEPMRESIQSELLQRGREHDEETAELMRRYCPHHQE
ncbi:pyridoxamine 5'-phosphate oxidase family protein [Paenibacillus sp. GCM10023252]|uniref:pyridoxamine 5'-phosphate oxidase family protein n=1 Tax=Paenibacillus sp. GCM10023252 TaxID=3252649 RepID=UPI00360D9043